jgi:hypothetical protein
MHRPLVGTALVVGLGLLTALAVACGPPAREKPPSPPKAEEPGTRVTPPDDKGAGDKRPRRRSEPTLPPSDAAPLTDEALAAASYRQAGGGQTRLATGNGEGTQSVRGDLDGDGDEDAVVILEVAVDGRRALELAAVRNDGGRAQPSNATPLAADAATARVESLAIDGRTIVVAILEPGPADAACCPTVRTTRRFALSSGSLVPGD